MLYLVYSMSTSNIMVMTSLRVGFLMTSGTVMRSTSNLLVIQRLRICGRKCAKYVERGNSQLPRNLRSLSISTYRIKKTRILTLKLNFRIQVKLTRALVLMLHRKVLVLHVKLRSIRMSSKHQNQEFRLNHRALKYS